MKRGSRPQKACCETAGESYPPSHEKQLNRLRRIRGQMEGVERMILERRHCPDIIVQVQAIRSALSSLESKLLEEHLHSCVRHAFASSNEHEKREKIAEIVDLVKRG